MAHTITFTAVKDPKLGPFTYTVSDKENFEENAKAYAQVAREFVKAYGVQGLPHLTEPDPTARIDLRNTDAQHLADLKRDFDEKQAAYVRNEPRYVRALDIITDERPVSETMVTDQDMSAVIWFYWWALDTYFVKS